MESEQFCLQVWKLYNTSSMDFHLFFCCHNVEQLEGRLDESERSLLKPLWQVTHPIILGNI